MKNIIFDLGGVLVGFDGKRSIEAYQAMGCERVADYIIEHRTEDLFYRIELGLSTTADYCDEVRSMTGTTATDDEIVRAWNLLLTPVSAERARGLRLLQQRGYRLFLLSNTNDMHWQHCLDELFPSDMQHVFERVFLSYEMKLAKPDVRIFEEVLSQAGIKAEDTLFIDDNRDNIATAGTLGIQTFLNTDIDAWLTSPLSPLSHLFKPMGCVATIGFFDGVHRGHQFVISHMVEEARRRGLEAVVVTLDTHPREVVARCANPSQQKKTQLLTTRDEARRLILEAGADRCEVLHFDQAMAQLSARDFMQTVLRDQLGVKVLMTGYDNRFGHRSRESNEGFDDYVDYGRQLGIEVISLPPLKETAGSASSSAIRGALSEGDVAQATRLLGRPYSIVGRVVHGFEEGHRLGFPTANIDPASVKTLIPAAGVYAVEVSVEGMSTTWQGMMNIGTRPTYGGSKLSLEAHLLDFDGDLYDKSITVTFLKRIREERTFASPDDLRHQLEADRAEVTGKR